MNKINKFYPIGTVVSLKEGTKKLMITGYLPMMEGDHKIYEYCGCLYPEGYLSSDTMLLFNNENIEKVICMGYEDNELSDFMEKLDKLKIELEKKILENSKSE